MLTILFHQILLYKRHESIYAQALENPDHFHPGFKELQMDGSFSVQVQNCNLLVAAIVQRDENSINLVTKTCGGIKFFWYPIVSLVLYGQRSLPFKCTVYSHHCHVLKIVTVKTDFDKNTIHNWF